MINNVPVNKFIEKLAEKLKSVEAIEQPVWAKFVKTGVHKERPPVQQDWWYIRCAAVFRSIYRLQPIGVSKLRTKYGGKKNMGMKPERFKRGSGNILRKCLQQLDKAGFTIIEKNKQHKGRIITKKGNEFLKTVARELIPK